MATENKTLPTNVGKVQEIINLMRSIESLQEANELCMEINNNPPLYGLVMAGVPPVVPPSPPAPKTEAEIRAEVEKEIRANLDAEIAKQVKAMFDAEMQNQNKTKKP